MQIILFIILILKKEEHFGALNVNIRVRGTVLLIHIRKKLLTLGS